VDPIDHLGIAVPNLAEAIVQWRPLLGPAEITPEVVPSQRVRVAFLDVGNTHIELLEATDAESPIAKFVASRGGGMHHVAFKVTSVDRELAKLAEHGRRLIDTVGRPGARGRRVGFAHPSAFGGVLVEFVEEP
jgi:methylmalonyl-CoA/ethylmalonyl-CoA epimerase